MSDLVISALCSCSSTVDGGKDIILLCEKVVKEDIEIRFFEEKTGWEAKGDFQHTDVHKQTAIKFRTPRYRTLDIDEPVQVSFLLLYKFLNPNLNIKKIISGFNSTQTTNGRSDQ